MRPIFNKFVQVCNDVFYPKDELYATLHVADVNDTHPIGKDNKFKFKDHFKSHSGHKIVPKPSDFYVRVNVEPLKSPLIFRIIEFVLRVVFYPFVPKTISPKLPPYLPSNLLKTINDKTVFISFKYNDTHVVLFPTAKNYKENSHSTFQQEFQKVEKIAKEQLESLDPTVYFKKDTIRMHKIGSRYLSYEAFQGSFEKDGALISTPLTTVECKKADNALKFQTFDLIGMDDSLNRQTEINLKSAGYNIEDFRVVISGSYILLYASHKNNEEAGQVLKKHLILDFTNREIDSSKITLNKLDGDVFKLIIPKKLDFRSTEVLDN